MDEHTESDEQIITPWMLRPVVVVAGDGAGTAFYALDVAAAKPAHYKHVARVLLSQVTGDGRRA